jgi:hypothetical protein
MWLDTDTWSLPTLIKVSFFILFLPQILKQYSYNTLNAILGRRWWCGPNVSGWQYSFNNVPRAFESGMNTVPDTMDPTEMVKAWGPASIRA